MKRDSKSEIWKLKSSIWSLKSDVLNLKCEMQNTKSNKQKEISFKTNCSLGWKCLALILTDKLKKN